MIENQESLREQVMISQFEMATGCTRDQSRQVLQAARWEFEVSTIQVLTKYKFPYI